MDHHNRSIFLSLTAAVLAGMTLAATRPTPDVRYPITDLGALPGMPYT